MPRKLEEKKNDGNDKSSSSGNNEDSLEDENDADNSHSSDLLYNKEWNKVKEKKGTKNNKVHKIQEK